MDFNETIKPFFWVEHKESYSVCLDADGVFKQEVFDMRGDEGFLGNGYDWGSLAVVFLEEQMPELVNEVSFDPEAGMFCAYSGNKEALEKFVLAFRAALDNDKLIKDLFSRAELD